MEALEEEGESSLLIPRGDVRLLSCTGTIVRGSWVGVLRFYNWWDKEDSAWISGVLGEEAGDLG